MGDCTITPTRSVRNLGAHFESRINMEEFIIKKCRACQLQLHKIARIHKYLSNDTCSCIIQGLVTSKLDYANCLLYGVNKVFLHRLQIVQNSAARVILKMRKYNHISRARQELLWLPIQQRIAFQYPHWYVQSITWPSTNIHYWPYFVSTTRKINKIIQKFQYSISGQRSKKQLRKTGFCSCCSNSVEQYTC